MSYRKPILVDNVSAPNLFLGSPLTTGGQPVFRALGAADIAAALGELNSGLPNQAGNEGKFLKVVPNGTLGTTVAWEFVLPTQVSGDSGKLLVADGSGGLSWGMPSVSFSGDATGSGSVGGSIALTLKASGVVAGSYLGLTVDSNGRITAADASLPANITFGNASSAGVVGVATLDGGGKVPTSQLPATILGSVQYQGAFDAANATLLPVGAEQGDYYISSSTGTVEGIELVGTDWIVFNGSSWDKIDNTDKVASVNGKVGIVVLGVADIAGAASTDSVNTLHSTIQGEFAAADATLRALLEGEFAAADATLHAVISGEISSLQASLNGGFEAADATLRALLEGEFAAADATLRALLEGEFAAADATLHASISAEVAASEATLHAAISAEVAASEATLKSVLEGEFAAADATLHAAVSAEIATLGSAVRGEFAAADATLHASISAEVSASEATLRALLEGEFAAADATLHASISAEVAASEATLKSVLEGEFAAADATLRALLEGEFAAADATLHANVAAEMATLGAAIRGEFAAADATLSASIADTANVMAIASKSGDYQMVASDSTILVDMTGKSVDVTITLPQTPRVGQVVNVKRLGDVSANIVIIDGFGAATIDGDLVQNISYAWGNLTMQWSGSAWFIL